MPTLIQNYKKQEASARLKKYYSMMSQAIAMSEIDHGPVSGWDKARIRDENGRYPAAGNRRLALEFFNKYLAPYLKYSKIDENPEKYQNEEGEADRIKIYLDDGATILMDNGDCVTAYVDINGDKLPNKGGRDLYYFMICPASSFRTMYFGTSKIAFGTPWSSSWSSDRDTVLNKCKDSSWYCTKLLQMDNWEFKDDYPYKL